MIDLHMHSCYSEDGEYSPEQLTEMCASQGITVMSVADHNCVQANEKAAMEANKRGIRYIPGIEIDCSFQGTDFHVLGYGIDFKDKFYAKIEENVRRQCSAASEKMLKETQNLGFFVTAQEMKKAAGDGYWKEKWNGELFAEVLLQKEEYKEHPLLKPYREGGERSDNPYVNFYWDYYSQGKPCHAPIHYPEMKEVIEGIHQSGGMAALAHPGVNLKEKEYLLSGIIALGIDGIEVCSSYHTEEQFQFYFEQAQKNHLYCTCGSDFHGKTKPAIYLGQMEGCERAEEEIKRFIQAERLLK